jgi:diamine N-acetyltransferase
VRTAIGVAVTLRLITPDNWEQCINLKTTDEQQRFVAANLYSLAQAKVFSECVPLAICHGETMVGFLMYAPNGDTGEYWIWRLMIDKKQQGKGYGRAAMQEAIRMLKVQPSCEEIWLDFTPSNVVAERLYLSLGFEKVGVDKKGEIVMRLRV